MVFCKTLNLLWSQGVYLCPFQPSFHLAFAVTNIEATRSFYVEKLGCKVGRSAERWIDFIFFGHQVSAHLVYGVLNAADTNPVYGEKVPPPHFGAILGWDYWHTMEELLEADSTDFIIARTTRFAGEVGEQATMFFATHQEMCWNFRHSAINR